MEDPDRLRLQYEIAVLQHQQNLMELAIHQVHVIKRRREREEVNRDSGSNRGSVGNDSLACMTSYLLNSVTKTRQPSRTSCGCPPEMFDELLTRVGPRITKQNTTYREALDPGLKLALTMRHLASGTKYQSMSYGWRVLIP